MKNETKNKTHWSFWIISILILFWHIMGVITFFNRSYPRVAALFNESVQDIASNPLIWVTIAFAVYSFSGLLGSVLLIFKKRISFYFLVLSTLGIVFSFVFTLSLVVSIIFLLYSMYCWKKGWLH